MPSSILLIQGEETAARLIYGSQHRVDWAHAMPLVLEKLGYLDVTVSGPEIMRDPRTWNRHAAILVPSLDPEHWDSRALELAGSGSAEVLLELPPPALHSRLGVQAAEPAPQAGIVAATQAELVAGVAERCVLGSTRLEAPQSRPVERAEELDWHRLDVPIDEERASAWQALSWDVERWSVSADAEALAEWTEAEGSSRRWPALIRRGSLVAASFSIFRYLGQQTTVQPFAGAEHLIWQRSTALEALFSALIDDMHRRAGVARARILPFPEGASWALNVRHDFDRAQSRKQVDQTLAVHADAGTAATWYWRSRHVSGRHSPRTRIRAQGSNGAAVARRVAAAPRQEVALHTEQLWLSAVEERKAIEGAVRRPVAGSSAHGDPNCFRWQGAPNVLWAERQGLDYTEFISHAHLTPHRFAILEPDGTVGASQVICLPHHESFDRSTTPGDAATDAVLAAAEGYVRAGGLMQVLNHPDLNLEELAGLLRRLPRAGRLDWTAAQAADWWRRTHVMSELKLDRSADGELTLRSTRGVRGAVLEILLPDGESKRFSIHIEAGDSITVHTGEPAAGTAPDAGDLWRDTLAPAFVRAAESYYSEHGKDPGSAGARSTIATNSRLIPGRVEATRRYLRELGGLDSLTGMRVLDCGSGFGAFAAHIASAPDAPLVTAIDNRAEFTAFGERVATEAGIEGIDYRTADMRKLDAFEDAAFDLAIVNNAFIYLPSEEDMERAAGELARVVSPDGYLFLFHANRWQPREPFTRAPIVHLLPPRAAGAVSRVTGWEHNHGRVRLISPPAMRRMLGRHGFDRIRTGTLSGGRVLGPPRSHVARYYAVVARRER